MMWTCLVNLEFITKDMSVCLEGMASSIYHTIENTSMIDEIVLVFCDSF